MTVMVLEDGAPVEVTLRRSARARRMTLRVSGIDNRVTLTLPRGVSEREAMAFARQKEAWIRSHLARHAEPQMVGLGSVLPLCGQEVEVVAGRARGVQHIGAELQVPGRPDGVGARVLGYLKGAARTQAVAAADLYADRLGRDYSGLSLRDTRSRWGSCTSAGRLMLSWRLVMAPRAVFDYVVAHEVAHLAEMNHSAAFWRKVEEIHGAYDGPRLWLREHGATLHRYRFKD